MAIRANKIFLLVNKKEIVVFRSPITAIRYYITADVLKTICYTLFDSHMRYIWGQVHNKTFDIIQRAQNKALIIISLLNLLNLCMY